MTDLRFYLNLAVNILVAIGTVGAVIVALFGNLRVKLWPPIIEAKLRDSGGELTTLTNQMTHAYVDDIRYYHLQVSNGRRWSAATNLTVRLVRIEEPGPDDQLQIKWTGDIPIGCRDQAIYPLTHVVGAAVDFDLLSIRRSNLALSLHPIIIPNNLATARSGETHMVVSLQVKSAEIDSNTLRFQVDWNGRWHEGKQEMQENLKITPLA